MDCPKDEKESELNMAENYQPVQVNTGSAQSAIQATPNVTPALDGLMSSIKEGFISADDIRKRVSSGPLEAATRAQDLADVTQVRPLQRQAAVAELGNVQQKQAFEAETLPILNEVKRATLAQAFDNAKQFGAPEEILKVFYASVPGFIPFDPEKLHDKKTGQVNLPYAIETIQKAHEAAAKIKASQPINVTTKNTAASGAEASFQQLVNPVTGVAMGAKIPTGVVEPNEAKATAAQASLSNDFMAERNRSDILKRFVPQLGAFEAIDAIRDTGTPPKNSDDLAILYEFIKILDPTSVVREGEKKFAESTAPTVQQWYNKVQGLWSDSNRTMDLDTRNNLFNTIDTLRTGAETSVRPELKRLSNLAIDRGVPLNQALTETELKLLLNGSAAAPTRPAPAPAPGAPATEPPLIDDTDRVAAAAAVRALPPNVRYAKLKSRPGFLVENPNYRP